jgi:hypothetical protein
MHVRALIVLGCLPWVIGPRAVAAQSGAPGSARDSVAFSIAVLQYALDSLAHDDMACVADAGRDPTPRVLAAIAPARSRIVRPLSACRVDSKRRPGDSTSLVVDTLTGRRGVRVEWNALTFDAAGGFVVGVVAYRNGLSATAWRCTGGRRARAWVVRACTVSGGA